MRGWLALAVVILVGEAAATPPHFVYVDRALAADKMRQYCSACHAIGNLKFIDSESSDDDELWDTILNQSPPGTNETWAKRIEALLDWPSDTPPDVINEPNWMPKGQKRLQIANDSVHGANVRHIILDTVRAQQ